jgi:hypothetical protein
VMLALAAREDEDGRPLGILLLSMGRSRLEAGEEHHAQGEDQALRHGKSPVGSLRLDLLAS